MEFTRLFDVFRYQLQHYPAQVALAEKKGENWIAYSSEEVVEQVDRVSKALHSMGIRKGDTIAMIANNSPQWNFLDLGIMQLGAVNVPVYTNINIDEYRFIFEQSQVKMVFVGDRSLYRKICSLQEEIPSIQHIYCLQNIEGIPFWEDIFEKVDSVSDETLRSISKDIQPNDLATIIYTSGTTGVPKGVMLSHNNIVSNAKASAEVIPIKAGHRVLSALPICHVFERMACFLFFYVGASVYYAERVESIGENLKEVKPHFFTTVPRLMEKLFEKIMEKGNELSGIKKLLFNWSMQLAMEYDLQGGNGSAYNMKLALARMLVFRKWQKAVGGCVLGIVSGAAALQPKLAKIFNAAGIPVVEGYGQTETSPVVSCNHFDKENCRIGTVGPVIPGVQVKIADDGEILVKGPNIMLGYYKMPELTAETIDSDGWLHTGDVGILAEGRFLKITDRKKEMFKTSGGKYVAPQAIENKFKESFFIENIMIVGENRKTISALIVPSVSVVEEWCKTQNLQFADRESMLLSEEVHKKFGKIRDEMNKHFSAVEQVKKFMIMPKAWTIEGGELTPTLKLKRKVIKEKYKAEILELYGHE